VWIARTELFRRPQKVSEWLLARQPAAKDASDRASPAVLGPLTCNGKITHGRRVYQVSSFLFACYAAAARRYLRFRPELDIAIPTTFSPKAVEAFVRGCQYEPVTITDDIVADVLHLSMIWDAPTVQRVAESKVSFTRTKITDLTKAHEHGLATDAYERHIRANFADVVRYDLWNYDLPVAVLDRAMPETVEPNERNLSWLEKCLAAYEEPACVLFGHLRWDAVSPQQIREFNQLSHWRPELAGMFLYWEWDMLETERSLRANT
jgi:hypothetical protein